LDLNFAERTVLTSVTTRVL